MPTVYGSTISSTFRSYLKYTVTETATNYKITVDDVGYDQVSSTYVYQGPVSESSNTLSYTLKLGSNTYTEYDSNVGYEQDASLIDWFEPYNKTITIAKTTSTQSVAVSFSFYTVKWIKSNINTGIGYEVAAATSTASATLTIPALGKPTVSLTAERDSSTDSTVKYTATIKSFSTDTISNCKLTVNGTAYTLTAGTVPSSGTLTITKTLTSQTLNRTTATLVATGKGGTSNTYTLTVPPAFYTLDIGNKGKEIAFGQSATTNQSMIPSNGLFSCGMDADFQGNVLIQGNNLIEKLKKMLCTAYTESLTVTAGTFTDNGCSAALVGNIFKLYISAKAKSAITAGNIKNQTMLTITFIDSRIRDVYPMSGSGGASGPNSQMQFSASSSGGQHTITVVLAAIAQNLSSGEVIDANISLPCILNWDAY